MKERQLEEDLVALLDGTLPPERVEALHRELRESPETRLRYYQHVGLHQSLTFRLGRSPAMPGHAGDDRLRQQRRRSVQVSLAVAAAALVAAALLLRTLLVPEPQPLARLESAPGSRFAVEHAGEAPDETGALTEGSRVTLDQGTLELTLAATGSRATLQAPASFVLEAPGSLRLERGSAFFHIKKPDVGFTVRTGELRVIDLGTEFGIHAFPDRAHEVHVIRGRVRVETLRGHPTSAELGAGEARLADPVGRLQAVDFDGEAFPDGLPDGLPELHFRFDRHRGPTLPVEGSLPKAPSIRARYLDAEGHPSRPRLVPGKIGQAIALGGDGDHVETDWPGLAGDLPRSVSFWTRVEAGARFTHMPAVANWGQPSGAIGKWKVLIAQEAASGPAVARISLGLIAYDGSTPLNDGKWHHVVAVFSSGSANAELPGFAIYVDGKPEALTRRQFAPLPRDVTADQPDTETHPGRARPLLIGLSIDPRPGSFPGLIDELRIHAGALDPDEAGALYELGEP